MSNPLEKSILYFLLANSTKALHKGKSSLLTLTNLIHFYAKHHLLPEMLIHLFLVHNLKTLPWI